MQSMNKSRGNEALKQIHGTLEIKKICSSDRGDEKEEQAFSVSCNMHNINFSTFPEPALPFHSSFIQCSFYTSMQHSTYTEATWNCDEKEANQQQALISLTWRLFHLPAMHTSWSPPLLSPCSPRCSIGPAAPTTTMHSQFDKLLPLPISHTVQCLEVHCG